MAAVRARAAADRKRAAADRERAARDRENAAEDRRQAITDLREAHLDDLTGFYRRQLGVAALEAEIDRARRTKRDLVFAFVDVDGLKSANDRDGHAAGDAVLRAVAKALKVNLRPYDPIVRIGGDEFVCALSDADEAAARQRFDAVRSDLQKLGTARVSVGLASLGADDTVGSLIERGDTALREERRRRRGRNGGGSR